MGAAVNRKMRGVFEEIKKREGWYWTLVEG